MAETTAQSTQSRHGRRTPPGLLSRLLGLPFRIVAVLVFSIISAVLIEWAGMAFQWWEQPGAEHALHMMHTEVGWLDSHFTQSLLLSKPVVTVQAAVMPTSVLPAPHAMMSWPRSWSPNPAMVLSMAVC